MPQMPSLARLDRAARYFAEYLWRPSNDELRALMERARINGTTREDEQANAWTAALLLARGEGATGPIEGDAAFNAARARVREDLLGLTRRQDDQSARADASADADALPADEGYAADAALLDREHEREMGDLLRAVASLAISATDRRHLEALARAKATGEPVPAATRMKIRRWKRRNAAALDVLRERVVETYE